jgi:bifunctional DNA-binding transcriptional regulator/antitoxin component of YhaV-PrlF toxin-antitoxin module
MAHLTKRSLFPIGDGGFAVTVPKSWCAYYDLKPKDRLIAVSDGFVFLLPDKLKLDEKLLARLLKNLRRIEAKLLDLDFEDGEAESG